MLEFRFVDVRRWLGLREAGKGTLRVLPPSAAVRRRGFRAGPVEHDLVRLLEWNKLAWLCNKLMATAGTAILNNLCFRLLWPLQSNFQEDGFDSSCGLGYSISAQNNNPFHSPDTEVVFKTKIASFSTNSEYKMRHPNSPTNKLVSKLSYQETPAAQTKVREIWHTHLSSLC